MSRTKKILAVTLLVVAVYGAILLWGDVSKLGDALSRYAWWTFAVSLALALSNYLLRFLKWQYYLARLEVKGIPWVESLTIFLSGFVMSITACLEKDPKADLATIQKACSGNVCRCGTYPHVFAAALETAQKAKKG